MPKIPFAPWMQGMRALSLVRDADAPRHSTAPQKYYSALLGVHETVHGELWSADAWAGIARSRLMEGDLEGAEAALTQAGMMGTPDPDVACMLAEILLDTGRAEKAHRLLTNVVEHRPRHARMRYLLGLSCRDLGLSEVDAYRAAVDLDPDLAAAWYRLGNALNLMRQTDAAIAAWRGALRAEPEHTATLYNLGQALHRTGDAEGAAECLARLRELDEGLADLLEENMKPAKPARAGARYRVYPCRAGTEG